VPAAKAMLNRRLPGSASGERRVSWHAPIPTHWWLPDVIRSAVRRWEMPTYSCPMASELLWLPVFLDSPFESVS